MDNQTNLKSFLTKLSEEGRIKSQETDLHQLKALLDSAWQNFSSAEYNFKGGYYETAFKSAYDGLLQISRVVLLSNGYRPDDGEQHKTTFRVARMMLGDNFDSLIDRIDRYRIKRNNAVYQPVAFISEEEAKGIIKTAKEYWSLTKKYFREKNPQLSLD